MSTPIASFLTDANFKSVLYIISFGLFIYGLSGLTGPKTAVRGNRIAAVGMAVAVIATLLVDDFNNAALIVIGCVVGTAIGVPAARNVKMTQMPQMVALFNGVGGGAVALIAWAEFRETDGFAFEPTYIAIFSVFSAIVGSISFWGSNVAFAKLQELIHGRPITLGALQLPAQILMLGAAIAAGVAICADPQEEIVMVGLLVAAAIFGLLLVLPIGAALVLLGVLGLRAIRADKGEMFWVRVGAAAGLAGLAAQSVWEIALVMPANAVLAGIGAGLLLYRRDAARMGGAAASGGANEPPPRPAC